VLRPKNAQNSTKISKNQLLQKKFFNFSMDQFSSFYGKNKKIPSKTSLHRFKLTYETEKKEEKNLMSRLEPLCPATFEAGGRWPRRGLVVVATTCCRDNKVQMIRP
jgi:hypothetical protein